MHHKTFVAVAAITVACAAAPVSTHITPIVIMRTQADVIQQTLPHAVSYFVWSEIGSRPNWCRLSESSQPYNGLTYTTGARAA